MTPQYASSAALLFTEQELGGPCLEQESYPIALVGGSIIVPGNGDRVGLTIMNLGTDLVYLGLLGFPTYQNGIYLPGQGGFLTLTVRDDFTLPSRQWNGTANSATQQMYVLEIIRFTSTPLGGV